MKTFEDPPGHMEVYAGLRLCEFLFNNKYYVTKRYSHRYNRYNFGFMGSL